MANPESALAHLDRRIAPDVPYGGPYYGYFGEDLSDPAPYAHVPYDLGKIIVLGSQVQAGDATDGVEA